jgi:xylan 1,4-beta-xylosidase
VALLILYFSIDRNIANNSIYDETNKNSTKKTTDEYDRNSERLKKILMFINDHYTESPSLNNAASIVFISPFHLSHLFTSAMGISYSQYLNHVKVNMARYDLASTNDSITDIMTRHGFSSAKTFNRVFKAVTGSSPSAYRKAIRAGEEYILPSFVEGMPGSYVNFHSTQIIPQGLYRDAKKEKQGSIHYLKDDTKISISRCITVNTKKSTGALDRYFLKMTGQARASDFLRKGVQDHFRHVQKEIGFEYVRFHGIFNDEMCVLSDDGSYNWTYTDEVIDFLLEINLRPFIEFSFMPSVLATGDKTVFFYKANVTPPHDYEAWGNLVEAFTKHIADRYTLDEIAFWYFEVWNEPNIDSYWAGNFEEYMRLYAVSAARIKRVSPLLKIGGPAVSSFSDHGALGFVENFLASCAEQRLPLDFVSGHPYPALYFEKNKILHEILLPPAAVKNDMIKLKKIVEKSAYKKAELHFDEWNSTARPNDLIHDTAFMAVFVLHNYLNSSGSGDSLCFWALTDRFEEANLSPHEFHGGFGLLSLSGFKKPQYYAFKALSLLGNEVLEQGEDYIITYSTAAGELQVLFWNYVHYTNIYAQDGHGKVEYYNRYAVFEEAQARRFSVRLVNFPGGSRIEGDYLYEKTVFNREHGSVFDFWLSNGALENMNEAIRNLMKRQCIPLETLEIKHTSGEGIAIEEIVEPFGFTLLRLRKLTNFEN